MSSKHGHNHHHHHHHHAPGQSCKGEAFKNIRLAFVLNLCFTIIEIVGGIMTQSVAVLSDAVHDAGDTISLGFALFLEKKAEKGPSKTYSYGMKRLSLLSAVISGVVITVGSSIVLWEAFPRILNPGEPHGLGMMGLAVFGIAINGLAALKLRAGHTQNEKVLTWHLMEDALGWTSVLVGGAFVYFFEWYFIDPLLAVLISIWIVRNVLRELNRTVSLFLQAVPDPHKVEAFEGKLKNMTGILSFHDLHFWSLDGSSHVLSLHLVTDKVGIELLDLKNKVREAAKVLGSPHITLEVETAGEDCHDNCDDESNGGHQ